jgi:plasmid maintenance system antidote protein VapI
MAYSQKIIDAVAEAPKSSGNQLGRWAIYLDLPVTKIASALGVTRQTVYNWFIGKTEVFVAYQDRVDLMIKIMQNSDNATQAWKRICQAYNLES